MAEIKRLGPSSNALQLDFVERVATPRTIMKMAIHLHLAGLPLLKIVSLLENFGISLLKSTIDN